MDRVHRASPPSNAVNLPHDGRPRLSRTAMSTHSPSHPPVIPLSRGARSPEEGGGTGLSLGEGRVGSCHLGVLSARPLTASQMEPLFIKKKRKKIRSGYKNPQIPTRLSFRFLSLLVSSLLSPFFSKRECVALRAGSENSKPWPRPATSSSSRRRRRRRRR